MNDTPRHTPSTSLSPASHPSAAPAAHEASTSPESFTASPDALAPQAAPFRFSPTRTAAALALLGLLGTLAIFKPLPQGVHAGDVVIRPQRTYPAPAASATPLNQPAADDWAVIGDLIGPKLIVRIETHAGETLYTVFTRSGETIATRITREEVQSLLPQLDPDSMHTSQLMLADDPQHP